MTAGLDNERLAVLVHEVRSPVAALAAVAETAADASGGEPDALPTLVRLALAACRAIERIVMDVAIASVRLEPMDVSTLVRDTVAAHTVRGADVAVSAGEGLLVAGDRVRLRQVVDNLIVNALVHGGSSEVTVHASRSEGAVHVVVSDAGPGIRTDQLDRIFEAGVRLDAGVPGSGLGLALARAIAEAHGGSLMASSAPGHGATFILALPALHAIPDQPDTAASSS